MGRALCELGAEFDLALISPARRAVETWALVSQEWNPEFTTREDRRLYGATVEQLVEIVAETEETTQRLLLVGHNPGFHQLALELTEHCDSPLREEIAPKFPTGSFVEIGLPIDRWMDIARSGELLRVLRPRDLG